MTPQRDVPREPVAQQDTAWTVAYFGAENDGSMSILTVTGAIKLEYRGSVAIVPTFAELFRRVFAAPAAAPAAPAPINEGPPAGAQGPCVENVDARSPDKGRAAANVATAGLSRSDDPTPSPFQAASTPTKLGSGPSQEGAVGSDAAPAAAPADPIRDALAALGVIGDGYCFCSENRDPHKSAHEPECRDARAALAEAPTAPLCVRCGRWPGLTTLHGCCEACVNAAPAAPAPDAPQRHLTRDEQKMLGAALRRSARTVEAAPAPDAYMGDVLQRHAEGAESANYPAGLREDMRRVVAHVYAQAREIAEARADAERWRFFRDADRMDPLPPEFYYYTMESLDELADLLIDDAARAATKGDGNG